MEKSSTSFKKDKPPHYFSPRKHIIANILNYSKSLDVFTTPLGNLLVSNN